MFRLWGKIWKNNRMAADTVICDDSPDTRTHKVFRALDEICYTFDLSKPIWLDTNIYSGGIPSVIFSSSVQKSERRDNQRSALLRYPPHWR